MSGKRLRRTKRRRRSDIGRIVLLLILILAVTGSWVWYIGTHRVQNPAAEQEPESVLTETVSKPEEQEEPAQEPTEEPAEELTEEPAEEPAEEPEEPSLPEEPPEPEPPVEPAGEESPVEIDEEQAVTEAAARLLESMTMEERIYQLFLVTQDQLVGQSGVTKSGEATKSAIQSRPVGGIVYFASNLTSREQTKAMIEGIQSYSRLGLLIAVDEEGGRVARLGGNSAMGTTAFPAMQKIGNSGDPEEAYNVGYTIGTEIGALGFNLDFAPVADVFSNPNNTVIGDRAFSIDPETAAAMVAACVKGFQDSGLLCTLKHFPGHGDTAADSHYGEAETKKTLEQLEECEFLPFEAGIEAGAPFVMIGHITVPNVTDEPVPATLSHRIITGLLREQLGFDGVIITDSMTMKAITDQYSSGEAAVMAIEAGADMILMPQNLQKAVDGVKAAVASGVISEERINESVMRILEAKIRSGIIDAA